MNNGTLATVLHPVLDSVQCLRIGGGVDYPVIPGADWLLFGLAVEEV